MRVSPGCGWVFDFRHDNSIFSTTYTIYQVCRVCEHSTIPTGTECTRFRYYCSTLPVGSYGRNQKSEIRNTWYIGMRQSILGTATVSQTSWSMLALSQGVHLLRLLARRMISRPFGRLVLLYIASPPDQSGRVRGYPNHSTLYANVHHSSKRTAEFSHFNYGTGASFRCIVSECSQF
eukprot:COSAG02_NODE_11634_length_1686_cov_1.353497_2_plen_177_part_00